MMTPAPVLTDVVPLVPFVAEASVAVVPSTSVSLASTDIITDVSSFVVTASTMVTVGIGIGVVMTSTVSRSNSVEAKLLLLALGELTSVSKPSVWNAELAITSTASRSNSTEAKLAPLG